MKRLFSVIMALSLIGPALAAGASQEQAPPKADLPPAVKAAPGVDLKVLPAAVLAAFAKAYPKAVIKGASKEVENGQTQYEIESVDGKMNRDLLYKADGTVIEVEEALAKGALPAPVLKALAKTYPGYKIIKAEDLIKDGQKLFELEIQIAGTTTSVTLDPGGKIIR